MKPSSWNQQLGLASPRESAASQSDQTSNPSKNELGLDVNHHTRIHGFRNRDLCAIFFPQTTDDKQQTRRHSAWISRKLRLLRAHALITKIVGTHRYQLTSTGGKIIVVILSALRSTVAPTHTSDSPTNHGRRIDALKNLCKRKQFWSLVPSG
jgi:hypothetical protein